MTPEQQLKIQQAAATGTIEGALYHYLSIVMGRTEYKIWSDDPNGLRLFADANGFYFNMGGFDFRVTVEVQDPR